jgi:hypothetical protein
MPIRLTIKLLALCFLAGVVGGCGNYETQFRSGYTYIPIASPKMKSGDAMQIPLRHDPYTVQASEYGKQRDPLLGHDPLLSGKSQQKDPLAGNSNYLLAHGTDSNEGMYRSTYGEYVLQGNIMSGEIEVEVNGTPVGTFSSYVNEDITHWCHNGENQVTFVHHGGSSGADMSAVHLQLFNRRKASDPITFTYDTMSQANADDTTTPAPSMTTDPNTGIDKPSIPGPGSANPPTIKDETSVTDERMFTDDAKSFEGTPTSK